MADLSHGRGDVRRSVRAGQVRRLSISTSQPFPGELAPGRPAESMIDGVTARRPSRDPARYSVVHEPLSQPASRSVGRTAPSGQLTSSSPSNAYTRFIVSSLLHSARMQAPAADAAGGKKLQRRMVMTDKWHYSYE